MNYNKESESFRSMVKENVTSLHVNEERTFTRMLLYLGTCSVARPGTSVLHCKIHRTIVFALWNSNLSRSILWENQNFSCFSTATGNYSYHRLVHSFSLLDCIEVEIWFKFSNTLTMSAGWKLKTVCRKSNEIFGVFRGIGAVLLHMYMLARTPLLLVCKRTLLAEPGPPFVNMHLPINLYLLFWTKDCNPADDYQMSMLFDSSFDPKALVLKSKPTYIVY